MGGHQVPGPEEGRAREDGRTRRNWRHGYPHHQHCKLPRLKSFNGSMPGALLQLCNIGVTWNTRAGPLSRPIRHELVCPSANQILAIAHVSLLGITLPSHIKRSNFFKKDSVPYPILAVLLQSGCFVTLHRVRASSSGVPLPFGPVRAGAVAIWSLLHRLTRITTVSSVVYTYDAFCTRMTHKTDPPLVCLHTTPGMGR